ncbi:MAG: hypothetical protein KDK39_03625 [Leptospiraceae bacterium]|nr:hypothetical protein [Leptospiraceae bacterium]
MALIAIFLACRPHRAVDWRGPCNESRNRSATTPAGRILLLGVALGLAACQSTGLAQLSEKPYLDMPEHLRTADPGKNDFDTPGDTAVSVNQNQVRTVSRDKNGRAITTVFSGAVLERRLVQRNGLDVVQIIIRGNALIQYDQIQIQAGQMVIEDNRLGQLTGRVHVIDRQSGVHLFAGKAIWNRDEQFVALEQNPYMLLYSSKNQNLIPGSSVARASTKPALVTCRRIMRDLEHKESRLLEDVRIHQEPWNLLGDKGVYRDGSDRMILNSNPVILGDGRFMSADHLEYIPSQKTVILDRRVVLLSRGSDLLAVEDDSAGSASKDPLQNISLEEFGRMGGRLQKQKSAATDDTISSHAEISALSADKIRFQQGTDDAQAETRIEGHVILTRKDLEVQSPTLVLVGANYERMYTEDGIEMLDRSRNMYVKAGVMDYRIKEHYLRLEDQPRIDFYEPGTQTVQATLSAAAIERDFKQSMLLAQGQVRLRQNSFEALAEQARYREREGVIILEGDPGIVNGASLIRSEKILYYPDKRRVFLYNRIRGTIGLRQIQQKLAAAMLRLFEAVTAGGA